MEGGREQNYWPGFVDALSNVVLTLVFVLVIFVFALVMGSNKVEQKVREESEKQTQSQNQAIEQENTELKKKVEQLTIEINQLRTTSAQNASGAKDQQSIASDNVDKQIQIEEKPQGQNQGGVQVLQKATGVVLSFPNSVAEVDEKSADKLGHILAATIKNVGKHKVIIRSIVGKETLSAAQRLAYYRAVGARNYLISKLQETPSDIKVSIVNPPKPEDGRVEIIFEKQ